MWVAESVLLKISTKTNPPQSSVQSNVASSRLLRRFSRRRHGEIGAGVVAVEGVLNVFLRWYLTFCYTKHTPPARKISWALPRGSLGGRRQNGYFPSNIFYFAASWSCWGRKFSHQATTRYSLRYMVVNWIETSTFPPNFTHNSGKWKFTVKSIPIQGKMFKILEIIE